MPATRQRTKAIPHKTNIRNGALLALSQTAKHVNLPFAQDVAQHIQHITLALKPSALQAPKANDSDTRELAKYIAGLLDALHTVLPLLENTHELDHIFNQLQDTHAELEGMREFHYATKLASQSQIQERMAQIKEEISRAMIDLTLRLLTVTVRLIIPELKNVF
ncbi:hypothetical protein B0J17DRAFT_766095 [Rhizoctonia solani]|nr:hypothetical protein B0J17DRAFT_766095 [Rhizoctonia solani]